MIRLRRAIDRGLANRWLRILLVILIVGLLVFVVFHGLDDATEPAAAACLAVIVVFLAIVVPRMRLRARRIVGLNHRRGPPQPVGALLCVPLAPALSTPLLR